MRLRLSLLAALAVAAVAVPVAAATIVVQKGMAGVTIGMTEAMVRGTLGDPATRKRGTNDFGPYTVLTYKQPLLTITFQGNVGVTSISTTGQSERTSRGVGVASTEAAVKAKVAGVKCKTEAGFRHCWVGAFLPGRRVTDFWIKQGRVTRVVVGLVID